MLNYIATGIIAFLLLELLAQRVERQLVAETKPLPDSRHASRTLNRLFEAIGFHFAGGVVLQGFLPFAILVGIGYYVAAQPQPLRLRPAGVGREPGRRPHSGVNPKRMVLITIMMSGAIAGLIGLGPLLADPQYYKYGDQFPQTLGFTGLVAGPARAQPPGRHRRRGARVGDDRAGDAAAVDDRHPAGDRHHPAGLVPARRRHRLRGRQAPDATPPRRCATPRPNARPTCRWPSAGVSREADDTATTVASHRAVAARRTRLSKVGDHVARRARRSVLRHVDRPRDRRRRRPDVVRHVRRDGCARRSPIALAGLGGLFAERSGTVNIGLEGMMVIGTIFAGWWGWQCGPWMALVGGVVGGMLGGLLHALATATFGVNHIVAGFAINIIAPGVARFMADLLFITADAGVEGGSISNSPGISGRSASSRCRLLSGGDLFGWRRPTCSAGSRTRDGSLISDVAGILQGLTSDVTPRHRSSPSCSSSALATSLWHTPFGLRLRSAGEKPGAADSLGVSVHRIRYYGMVDLRGAGRPRRRACWCSSRQPLPGGPDPGQRLPRSRHAGRSATGCRPASPPAPGCSATPGHHAAASTPSTRCKALILAVGIALALFAVLVASTGARRPRL